jgi:serine/threonine protein kinase/tetratricopeptide (TPR) repeat protein
MSQYPRGADELEALTGATLGGRYELLRFIRRGALGAVFEARNASGGSVAVKVIRRALVSDDALSRLIRTASVIAGAEGRHLVPILDVGHDLERDLVFLVMPLLEDGDLASLVARTGPLAPLTAVRLALAAAEAVAAAHALDIVHRNVKPSNLFLETDASGAVTVRVADVGITGRSLFLEAGLPSSRISWQYVSPEQAGQSKSSDRGVDRRTDVFSLGATLYELLSGAPPWSGATSMTELVAAMSSRDAVPLQDVAPWVESSIAAVVERALSRDPERRFAGADALASRLRALAGGDARVTTDMLVPIDPALRSFAAPRLPDQAPSAFAPTIDSGAAIGAPADPLVGHRLGGRYVVRRLLGHGGMGAVYEVEASGGARFAAKVILRDIADQNVALLARFLREGRSVTRIQDVHVTRTIELGTDITLGVPFIVMERLEGRDLGALFQERGAIEPVPLLRVFIQAARGLAAAHAEGVVHRDIKPANVFLHAPDAALPLTAKICDFGLAKATASLGVEHSSHELTRSGGMLGTPLYMSPEHATSARNVDPRTDVWSLCVSLYEGLSGKKPWAGITSLGELIAAICTRPVPSLAEAAPWLDPAIVAVVEKGLERDLDVRWHRMDALVEALLPLAGGSDEVRLSDLVPVDARRRAMRARLSPRADTWAPAGSSPSTPIASSRSHATVGETPAPGTAPSALPHLEAVHAPGSRGVQSAKRAAGVALIAACTVGAVLASRHARVALPVAPPAASAPVAKEPRIGPPDFGSRMSSNAAATAAYRAAIQALRDGAGDTARQKLDEATEADPTFAAAHLRRLVLAIRASEPVRAHAASATQLRADLSDHDRALLDAYLPWISIPQEASETERKLSALVAAHATDSDYAYFLCRIRVFLGDYSRAADACAAAARIDPELVDALHYQALNLAYLDDVPAATRAYERCLAASRMATSCLSELTVLHSAEGKCTEAVSTARRWTVIEPTSPYPSRALAYALHGAGEPIEAVRDVLDRMWAPIPAEEREIDQRQVLGALDLAAGRFAEADARLREWQQRIASSPEEAEHALVVLWRAPLLIEMGRNEDAKALVADFVKRRAAWSPTPNADYSIAVRAIQLQLGSLSRAAYREARDAWLADRATHERIAGQPKGFDWSLAFSHAVLDRAEALEALEALPRFMPLPDASSRTPDIDEPIANVYILAGRPAEALPFALRAARSCLGLDAPLEATRAYFRIGQASAMLGDRDSACRAYRQVVARWGGNGARKEPSVTAREATAAIAKLGCAPSP